MKILQTIQRQFALLDIVPSNQTHRLSNKILLGFSSILCSIVSQLMYIFRVASGIMDYMGCICSMFASINMFVSFAAIVSKRALIFQNLETIENLIDSSKTVSCSVIHNFLIWIEFHSASINVFLGCKYPKSRKFFLKTNRQVERLSEISFMLQMKVFVQCFMLPKFIASIGLYFITDSGNDALQLPIPMW